MNRAAIHAWGAKFKDREQGTLFVLRLLCEADEQGVVRLNSHRLVKWLGVGKTRASTLYAKAVEIGLLVEGGKWICTVVPYRSCMTEIGILERLEMRRTGEGSGPRYHRASRIPVICDNHGRQE